MRHIPLFGIVLLLALPGCGNATNPNVGGLDTPPSAKDAADTAIADPDDGAPRDLPSDRAGDDDATPETGLPDGTVPDGPLPDDAPVDAVRDVQPDVPQIVLPNPLCQPCRTDLECQTLDVQAPCLEDGPDGRTCGLPCTVDGDCPEDFQCTRDDAHGRQCRPREGKTCPCLHRFVEAGFLTVCYRDGPLGRCTGQRRCDEECPVSAPVAEICNGRDDDCNDRVDDGLGTVTCGKGACEVTVQACVGGQPRTCVPHDSSTEICDGIDNDCDGDVDEDLGTQTCGLGICQVTVEACIGGRPQPCWPKPSTVETCNGLDDNCDGDVDEGFGQTTCGVGECRRTVSNCDAGGPATCVPGQPTDEICNGKDDNCDGQADEGLDTVTCGVGACLRSVVGCVDGVPSGIPCVPGDGTQETCNGLDDDCDGSADEDFALGGACDGPDADQCATGHVGCLTATTTGCIESGPGFTETCNGLDDNCDGQVDEEGCPCPVVTRSGHAYMFCTPTAHWDVARDTCAKWGYHLAKIDDAAENQWIVDTAKARSNNEWWIGLNDRADEGAFVWLDGSAPGFAIWMSGQPNNGGLWPNNQDCVGIIAGTNAGYGWNDGECDQSWRFVCEYP